MGDAFPWDTGDDDLNWAGCFIPGSTVLRNRVGARGKETLAAAENDLVELREGSGAVKRTYDLAHLKALHRYLFQDVYLWAGELRTVGIEKEGESFMTPDDIGQPVDHIAAQIADTKQLRSITDADLHFRLAEMYDFINFEHPFREGNGRTQREFFDQLLSESGPESAWGAIELIELHRACHIARAEQNIESLRLMFARIVDDDRAYIFD